MQAWQRRGDAQAIEAMARATLDKLPAQFRAHLGHVVIRVEEQADPDTLAQMGIGNPLHLSGLYSGVPVGSKSIDDSGRLPDMIRLYRLPILAEAEAEGYPLPTLVAHVLIHEIGHHFGLSDEDIFALEDMVEDERD